MNQKQTTLIFNIVGLALGLTVVIVGIFLPLNSNFLFRGAYTYGDDAITFGSDFYTYEYNATQTISKNTSSMALTMKEINENINQYASFAFILAGLLIMLTYAKKLFTVIPFKATNTEKQTLPIDSECCTDVNIS